MPTQFERASQIALRSAQRILGTITFAVEGLGAGFTGTIDGLERTEKRASQAESLLLRRGYAAQLVAPIDQFSGQLPKIGQIVTIPQQPTLRVTLVMTDEISHTLTLVAA